MGRKIDCRVLDNYPTELTSEETTTSEKTKTFATITIDDENCKNMIHYTSFGVVNYNEIFENLRASHDAWNKYLTGESSLKLDLVDKNEISKDVVNNPWGYKNVANDHTPINLVELKFPDVNEIKEKSDVPNKPSNILLQISHTPAPQAASAAGGDKSRSKKSKVTRKATRSC